MQNILYCSWIYNLITSWKITDWQNIYLKRLPINFSFVFNLFLDWNVFDSCCLQLPTVVLFFFFFSCHLWVRCAAAGGWLCSGMPLKVSVVQSLSTIQHRVQRWQLQQTTFIALSPHLPQFDALCFFSSIFKWGFKGHGKKGTIKKKWIKIYANTTRNARQPQMMGSKMCSHWIKYNFYEKTFEKIWQMKNVARLFFTAIF